MTRTPDELRTWLAEMRREQRDDDLLLGKAKPRSHAETLIWHAGMVDRFDLDAEPDDDGTVSAVEQAVAARIAAARARTARQQADRARRRQARAYGLAARHAAKLAHQNTKGVHTMDAPNPQETDHA